MEVWTSGPGTEKLNCRWEQTCMASIDHWPERNAFFSNFRRQRMDIQHEMRKKGKLLVQGSSAGPWGAESSRNLLGHLSNLSSGSIGSTTARPLSGWETSYYWNQKPWKRLVLYHVIVTSNMPCKKQWLWSKPPALSSSYHSSEAAAGERKDNPTELLGGVVWICDTLINAFPMHSGSRCSLKNCLLGHVEWVTFKTPSFTYTR